MSDESTDIETLIPVHVGRREPVVPAPTVLGGGGFFGPSRDAPLLSREFDWAAHHITPRWLGMESSDCLASVEPERLGGNELRRFLAGAASRGETAVLIATVGNANDDGPPGLLRRSSWVMPGDGQQVVFGRRAPAQTTIAPAPGIEGPDRDLGLRLKRRPSDAPWWELWVQGTPVRPDRADYGLTTPNGALVPILLDAAGEPVVGVWVSDAEDQRWYLVPDQSDWDSILDWLVSQALPQFASLTLRRLRSPLLRDPNLMTIAESDAEEKIRSLDDEYERDRAELIDELQHARDLADPIRDGLLYGTGKPLERAVGAVLQAAGIRAIELDVALRGTRSADLLAELDGRRRLIEVKSSAGNAPESHMSALEGHLRNWPGDDRPEIEGGALVVNHQHRLLPSERSATPYEREEFLRNLPAPVISSRQLFDWWRQKDWESIREAVFRPPD